MDPHSIDAFEAARKVDPRSVSSYERWAIPYKFQPVLSVPEAAVAALLALGRIFLGSILFGVSGALALRVWFAIGNPFLGVMAMIPIAAAFIAALAAMLRWTARHPLRQR